jgi:hypothetical protein
VPYCPHCRSEYRDGFVTCADCHLALSSKLPLEPQEPAAGWVEIFRGTEVQAGVICASLDDAGIDTVFPDQYISTLGYYAPGSFNAIRVFVKAADVPHAKEVLAAPPAPPEA